MDVRKKGGGRQWLALETKSEAREKEEASELEREEAQLEGGEIKCHLETEQGQTDSAQ